MEIKVRKATTKDMQQIKKIDTFGEILNQCSPLDKLDPNYKPKEGEKNYYEIYISEDDKWCYVAENKDKIIGFVLFNIENREPYYEIKKVGYLDLIVVDKEHRKKGVSKLLFNKVAEIFREQKLEYIKLSFQTSNKLANKVWKKYGFKEFRVDLYKEL
jgi:ribosomal protein S18 acetylase RimI-like enzyme